MKSYDEELQQLHHRRVYAILLAGSIIMVLSSVLDTLLVPDYQREFLFCRLGGAAAGLLLLAINYYDRQYRHPLAIGFIGYICGSLVILAMIYQMGGIESPYYVGLILAMTIYAALAPLTHIQTLASGLLPVALYCCIVLLAAPSPGSREFLLQLYANLFFLVSVVLIIATQSWADTRGRRREYQLRVQENEAAEELALQAKVLEREVEQRSREQAEIEARYRLLFNQIADDVVLITPDTAILQANTSFLSHFSGNSQSAKPRELLSCVVPNQREQLQQIVEEMLASTSPIRNRPLRLVRHDETVVDAELSGNILRRGQEMVGLLLLIRDISARRQMERQLLHSLETRKETETAAILALAKLSEFKDATASNHLERIREYCRLLAMELAGHQELQEVMTPTYIEDICHASILHDIGKVSIPDTLPDNDPREQHHDLLRRHTLTGGDVIRAMEAESKSSSYLEMAKHIAYFHHERWDGRGHPHGLAGRQIPLAARIMALADTYEEMTAGTVNNPRRMNHEETVDAIVAETGRRFDPLVVGAFTAREQEFRKIMTRLG
jgi:PAS domain S-box-containing protein